jgi:hypothetical protein
MPAEYRQTIAPQHRISISTMDRKLTKVDYCFYIDERKNVYFSVSDFFAAQPKLRDTPESRSIVAEEIKQIYPGIMILEEEN